MTHRREAAAMRTGGTAYLACMLSSASPVGIYKPRASAFSDAGRCGAWEVARASLPLQ